MDISFNGATTATSEAQGLEEVRKVVEAKNESAGVVYGDIPNPECIVTVGRP